MLYIWPYQVEMWCVTINNFHGSLFAYCIWYCLVIFSIVKYQRKTRNFSIIMPSWSRPSHCVKPADFKITLFVPVLYQISLCATGMEAWGSNSWGWECWWLNCLFFCTNRCFASRHCSLVCKIKCYDSSCCYFRYHKLKVICDWCYISNFFRLSCSPFCDGHVPHLSLHIGFDLV